MNNTGNYGIIDWYISNHTFDKFEGETRDEVLTKSSDNFFDELKQYAKGNPSFTYSFRSAVASSISSEADEYFDSKIKEKINSSNLRVPDLKEDLLDNANNYNSIDEVDEDVDAANEYLESLRDTFSNAETEEERERARDELRAEAPKVYANLRSQESKQAKRAFEFITR